MAATELGKLLSKFFKDVRKENGNECEPSWLKMKSFLKAFKSLPQKERTLLSVVIETNKRYTRMNEIRTVEALLVTLLPWKQLFGGFVLAVWLSSQG